MRLHRRDLLIFLKVSARPNHPCAFYLLPPLPRKTSVHATKSTQDGRHHQPTRSRRVRRRSAIVPAGIKITLVGEQFSVDVGKLAIPDDADY
jgi:hypothetical protein